MIHIITHHFVFAASDELDGHRMPIFVATSLKAQFRRLRLVESDDSNARTVARPNSTLFSATSCVYFLVVRGEHSFRVFVQRWFKSRFDKFDVFFHAKSSKKAVDSSKNSTSSAVSFSSSSSESEN